MLPLGAGRFVHLVVLYGYQGADTDAEQLALTEQLFDAALGELVGRWRDFGWLWVDLESAWALLEVERLPLLVSVPGDLLVVTVETSW